MTGLMSYYMYTCIRVLEIFIIFIYDPPIYFTCIIYLYIHTYIHVHVCGHIFYIISDTYYIR